MSTNTYVLNPIQAKAKSPKAVVAFRTILIFLVAANIYPLIFVILTSLKSKTEFWSNFWLWPEAIHLENYSVAWKMGNLGEYFLNSLVVVGIALALVLILGCAAGYALARLNVPFSGAIMGIVLVVIMLPTESIVMPLYMSMVRLGFINTTYVPTIVAYIGWCLPLTIVVMRNFFRTVPVDLFEAARIDGCSELTTLVKVILPTCTPAVATSAVFAFCYMWGELMWAQIATSGTKQGVTLPCGLLAFQGLFGSDWGAMCAAICVILLPLIVMFLFVQKYFLAGLTAGATKG